ncbi:MAG TPA: hypothetical protein PLJ35_12690 [Anaerolineae bacterium]|nr:hypothetical protein [Anaerolineae bacterium]HOQ99669.1 hypothetical protein [Anaerolineae bacterium]HPL30727.1 hypothetical protein [Anaerolineae bacterium]
MAPHETAPGRIGRHLVRALDARLRRAQGTFVFSDDPDCILRLSLITAQAPLRFNNGAAVAPGDQLIVIHFWNERLPAVPAEGPDLRWARTMIRQSVASLRLLAQYLESRPDLAGVRAIGSDVAGFLTVSELDTGAVFPRLGFEMQRPLASAGPWQRFLGFWEGVYSWLLVWTYNPATLRGKAPWSLERFGMWMPRTTLEARYGHGAAERGGT